MGTTRSTQEIYLRASEAAALLRVSAKTVSRWAKQGRIPHVLTLGGHRRFPREAIESLADRLVRVGVAD